MALIFGIALAAVMQLHTEARTRAGREAFMAEETRRWDTVYARPHHFLAATIMGVGSAVLLFGAYELTAAGLCWLITKACPDERPNS